MKRIIVLAMLLSASVLAGCGNDEARLSKDEFVKQGNALCARLDDQLGKAITSTFPQSGAQPDDATITKFIKETFVPIATTHTNDLAALDPTKGLQAKFDALIAHSRAVLADLNRQADTNPAALFDDTPFVAVNREAGALGLSTCAELDEGSS